MYLFACPLSLSLACSGSLRNPEQCSVKEASSIGEHIKGTQEINIFAGAPLLSHRVDTKDRSLYFKLMNDILYCILYLVQKTFAIVELHNCTL